jgi:hypothetical protein
MGKDQHTKQLRKGEEGHPPERRTRTFFRGDGWYFMTREHIDVGPFATQEQAELGVQDYAGFSMDVDRLHAEPAIPVPDESVFDDVDVDEDIT